VAAIVQDDTAARHVISEGRKVVVYTLEEIARLLSANSHVARVKEVFPGAEVIVARRSVEDPLAAIYNTSVDLDDYPTLPEASIPPPPANGLPYGGPNEPGQVLAWELAP
jgi:hypothetical protein